MSPDPIMSTLLGGSVWPAVVAKARAQGGEPFLVFLAANGDRTELSGTSMLNGVAKLAGALVDEAGLEPGSRIAMHLPWHWQRVAWALGAWTAGAVLVIDAEPGDADLVVADRATALTLPDTSSEIWVVSLHPLGLPETDLPGHLVDAASAIRLQPDALLIAPAEGDGPAIELGDGTSLTRAQAAAWVADECARAEVGRGGRLLVAHEPIDGLHGWLLPALMPLVRQGSIVLGSGQPVADLVAHERTSVTLA